MAGLTILFPYTGDSIGGSHVSSLLLARALRGAGHHVRIGLHRPGGPLEDWLGDEGETWITLPDVEAPKLRAIWRQTLRRRAVWQDLAPVLAKERFDIVHTHDMRNHLIWNAATMQGPPQVWHQRTPASGRHMTQWGRRADAFVAVSDFTLQSLPRKLRPHARMIYNPFIPQERASDTARRRLREALGVPSDTAVIGYVANFSDRKRPELFVEIAGRVRARAGGPVAFAMFGTPNEPHLGRVTSRAAALGLGECLHVMGRRSPFGTWMAGLSVLVAPARHEALGRTLIEAGFAGIPVVATDEGGNREIIARDETGWLVKPDDADRFAEAVCQAIADPGSRCDAARGRVSELFSLESHLAAVEALYSEILARR